jgi:hypothetical protein
MKRLMREQQATFAKQKAEAESALADAKADLAELMTKVEELKESAAAGLEIKTNVPEIEEQVEKLKALLEEISNREWTVKINEGHAAGGWALGSDTVPAMLTPGEFIVNARAAARNAALLQAINAGASMAFPGRYARGGPVGGVPHNDNSVNVTFHGPADRDYVRRVILPEIRRAADRGRGE